MDGLHTFGCRPLPNGGWTLTAFTVDGKRIDVGEPVEPIAPSFKMPWEAPQDPERFYAGDRVCRHCHGSGQYSTDTGFTAGPAVYDCPTCHGAGSL